METRRDFLKAGAAALTVAATKPLFGVQGANDRIRMAVIGCGNRSGRVFDAFARQSNVQWVAGAEVNKLKLEGTSGGPAGFMTPARQTFKLDMVTDYRRILDRKDVDAVLIGTPDHWHHPADDRRDRGGQGCLRRKACRQHHPPPERDARRVQEGQADRAGRHAAAQLGSLHGSEEGPRQRHPRQHHAHLYRPARLLRAAEGGRAAGAGNPRLGHVAGSGAEAAVQAKPPGLPRLVRVRRRAGGRLGRASRRRRALVHERRQPRSRSKRPRPARSSPCPTPIPSRCRIRSPFRGSTTSSS